MIYGSICSGIEAATLAWDPLGWKPSFFSEIDKSARAVLKHHWPDVALHGDFTTIKRGHYAPIDLLVGGTPCQDFSVAGLRAGLAGVRGSLTLKFVDCLEELNPQWFAWENVPGVLSADGGRAFGFFLRLLAKRGYGFAYRILDAQYYGLAQRRRRVFVVGYFGDWRPPAAVLFDAESLSRNPPPRRQTGQGLAGTLSARTQGGGELGTDLDLAGGLQITHSLRGEGFDASEDGTGRGIPLIAGAMTAEVYGGGMGGRVDAAVQGYAIPTGIPETCGTLCADSHPGSYTGQDAYTGRIIPVVFDSKGTEVQTSVSGIAPPLRSMSHRNSHSNAGGQLAVAISLRGREGGGTAEMHDAINPALRASQGGGDKPHVLTSMSVRRLTPRECERLMGMPDDHTLVPFGKRMMSDSQRYKMIGNSMAVPVMRKIGERIDFVRRMMEKTSITSTESRKP